MNHPTVVPRWAVREKTMLPPKRFIQFWDGHLPDCAAGARFTGQAAETNF